MQMWYTTGTVMCLKNDKLAQRIEAMHPLVRNLYKRCLIVGKVCPQGLEYARNRAKTMILQNSQITDDLELKRAVHKGRYMVKEMEAICMIHKYRSMRKYDLEKE